jgi:NAD(P)-dependent dehydrogenase (short-subunit alcohol dehydrogenase family)
MRILVTGARGAIGAGIMRQLVARGDLVIAHDVRGEEQNAQADAGVTVVKGNLLAEDDRAQLARVWGDGPLDCVIAAHGVDGSGALADLDPAFVERVLSVNAASIPPLLRLTLPALRQARGTFVVVASQAGLQAEANNAAYCASKFAMVGWVRALAPAMRAEGVALRALCPGCTKSPLLFGAQARFAAAQGVPLDAFLRERMVRIAVGRFAEVEETAAAALYLADKGDRPVIFAATGGEVLH